MSQYSCLFLLQEEYVRTNGQIKIHTRNLPHVQQIRSWLPDQWASCAFETTFTGILKDQVQSCCMNVWELSDRNRKETLAQITLTFVKGFRLTQKRKEECQKQLEAQWQGGWSKAFNHRIIPNTNGSRLWLQSANTQKQKPVNHQKHKNTKRKTT